MLCPSSAAVESSVQVFDNLLIEWALGMRVLVAVLDMIFEKVIVLVRQISVSFHVREGDLFERKARVWKGDLLLLLLLLCLLLLDAAVQGWELAVVLFLVVAEPAL